MQYYDYHHDDDYYYYYEALLLVSSTHNCQDNMVMVLGEITTKAKLDNSQIVRAAVKKIGYDTFEDDLSSVGSKGLSDKTCEVSKEKHGAGCIAPGADQRHETGMPPSRRSAFRPGLRGGPKDMFFLVRTFVLGLDGSRRRRELVSAGSVLFEDPWSRLIPIDRLANADDLIS